VRDQEGKVEDRVSRVRHLEVDDPQPVVADKHILRGEIPMDEATVRAIN
jgi:hypothetical protein